MSVRAHASSPSSCSATAPSSTPAGGLVEELRAVKDADEMEAIRAAAQLADEAYRWLISSLGLAGRTERAVALGARGHVRDLGAEACRFPPIVAAGAHGALPHAEPRDVEIPQDTLVVIDFGAQARRLLLGLHADLRDRRLPGDEAREIYELVLRAQEASLAAVAPGADGREVDALARALIDAAGHGEHFGHGLGHGVGLEVHEAPRVAPERRGRRSPPATSSPSSPASTCRGTSACGSRIWSSSARTGPAC